MINTERLILEFKTLLTIESPSKREGKLAYYLADLFEALGFPSFFDKSGENTGSEVGNLIVKIPGKLKAPPLMFCAHLDTVGPCEDVEVIEEDGIIKSNGKTILGADDKAGVAVLIEIARIIRESDLAFPPVELVFTTCEEIGLLGAKYLDYRLIESKLGFVLDSEDPQEIINRAPSSYQFLLKVYGKSAHAGLEPEKGINAIKLLAQVVSQLPTGRIDEETTMNIGKINGGAYVNVVPDLAFVEGEMRSHSEEKLSALKEEVRRISEEVVKGFPKRVDNLPDFKLEFTPVFRAFHILENTPEAQLLIKAGERAGLNIRFRKKEGGSDANVFNERGIRTFILGTGMQKVHTTEEFIRVSDLIASARLTLEILRVYSETFSENS